MNFGKKTLWSKSRGRKWIRKPTLNSQFLPESKNEFLEKFFRRLTFFPFLFFILRQYWFISFAFFINKISYLDRVFIYCKNTRDCLEFIVEKSLQLLEIIYSSEIIKCWIGWKPMSLNRSSFENRGAFRWRTSRLRW